MESINRVQILISSFAFTFTLISLEKAWIYLLPSMLNSWVYKASSFGRHPMSEKGNTEFKTWRNQWETTPLFSLLFHGSSLIIEKVICGETWKRKKITLDILFIISVPMYNFLLGNWKIEKIKMSVKVNKSYEIYIYIFSMYPSHYLVSQHENRSGTHVIG